MIWILTLAVLLQQQQPPPPTPPPPPDVEEQVVVTTTRTGRLASDQPLRVEVVTREEIEEKLLMTPGDIAMLLNETSGLRLQATSPALGAAAVRVQGLAGRYTTVLTDGLPTTGTQSAAIGLLQIPPMDLQQVEVVKGAASALYGASALGGVINLITRTPSVEHEREFLTNLTSRGGADQILWLSGPAGGRIGYTLLAGAHTQAARDVDADGWADLPRYRRAIVRPRVAFAGDGITADVSGTVAYERRTGGPIADHDPGDQAVTTRRQDVGASARRFSGRRVLTVRAAASFLAHDHQYGASEYRDRHESQFAEAAWSGVAGAHVWVAGAAVDRQAYRSRDLSDFDYAWTTPGVFLQDDWAAHERVSLSASARVDRHPAYGTFASPRVSALVRVAGGEARASYGAGFFAPTPLTEDTDEVGLTMVTPPTGLRAERGRTWSLDFTRALGPVEITATAFGARVRDPLGVTTVDGRLVLANRAESDRASGAELFARLRAGDFVVNASHAWVRATEGDGPLPGAPRVATPLTPRQSWSVVAAWEAHGLARVGLEIYRTGRQRLDENPYRTESPAYTIVGLLAERRLGPARLFINFENLTDARLSRTHPFLRPAPTSTGRWTVDAWAPLEGRTVNGGVRVAW